MKRLPFGIFIILFGLLMSACAPMKPAPTGESWPEPPPKESKPAPKPSTSKSQPAPSGKIHEPSSAVQSLLDRGWVRYRQDDYQGALGIAERAQRIDARSPDVYLLMASAQFGLYRLSVAEQLTRKGLAISASGTPVYRQLQSLLSRITAASR